MIPFASFADMVGIVGVVLYLASYAAMQLGFLRGQTYTYASLNAGAAGCVLFSLAESFNLSAALIQVCWIMISIAGIVRLSVLHHRSARVRFAEEEWDFLDAKLPMLSRPLARRLLDAGYWIDGEPGVVLAREGEPVPEPIYLASGAAAVSLEGQVIGYCHDDTFIGELTCMTGTPATATVTLSAKSRYFCLGAATLRQLTSRHAPLQRDLQDAFAGDICKKLIMAGPYQRQAAAGSSSACGDRMASKRTIEPRGHTAFACDPARFIHEAQSR